MVTLSEIRNTGLLAGNLFLVGVLFLLKNTGVFRRSNLKLFSVMGWFLEFGTYSAGMIELVRVIIRGIETGGNDSVVLQYVRILVTESMIMLYLMLYGVKNQKAGNQGLNSKQTHGQGANGQEISGLTGKAEGEYLISFALLLGLILQNWEENNLRKSFVLQIACLSVFLLLVYLKTQNRKIQIENGEKEIFLQQKQKEEDYIRNVDRQYQRTRELWHDLKNHIGVLEILAKEHKYEELTDYLKSFQKDVESRMIPLRTGSAAVDALLSDKIYHAKKKDIKVSIQLCDLSEITMDATDLCVVLGNLFDNAVEACEKLPESGYIELRLKKQENFYYLNLTNTALKPEKQGGAWHSGKKDYENGVGHGLGLRSVERIAHQYGGSMITDYEDGRFRVVVRLQEEKEIL